MEPELHYFHRAIDDSGYQAMRFGDPGLRDGQSGEGPHPTGRLPGGLENSRRWQDGGSRGVEYFWTYLARLPSRIFSLGIDGDRAARRKLSDPRTAYA
jgi:hypothetical protein